MSYIINPKDLGVSNESKRCIHIPLKNAIDYYRNVLRQPFTLKCPDCDKLISYIDDFTSDRMRNLSVDCSI